MKLLVIAEHDQASIQDATRHAVMAASQIVMFTDAQVHLVVIGHEAAQAAQAGAHIAGVAQVIHLGGAASANSLVEDALAQLLAIAAAYSHILVASSAWGRQIAQHLAVELGVTLISEIVSIESADTFGHATHAGRGTATAQSTDGVKVLTVRTSRFEAASATGGSATVQSGAATVPARPGRPGPAAAMEVSGAADEPIPHGYCGLLLGEGVAIAHEARPFNRGAVRTRRGALDSLNPGL